MEVTVDDISTSFLWETALLLVSLDRVTPFWDELGLRFAAPDRVIGLARAFVTAQERLKRSQADRYTERISGLLRQFFADLRGLEGDEGAVRMRDWIAGRFIVKHQGPPWREVWQVLLARLDETQEAVLVRLGMPADKARVLTQFSAQWERARDAIDAQIEQAELLPRLGWDGQQYDDYQSESDLVSPLDLLGSYLRALRFDAIWARVRELLDAEEIEELNTWGQIFVATRTTIPLASAELPASERIRP